MNPDPSPDASVPGSVPGAPPTTARRSTQQAGETVMAVLARLIPLARSVAAFIKALAVASICAVAVIMLAVLSIDLPRTPVPWLILLVSTALMIFPAMILWLFYRALEEVIAVPGWLASSPDLARRHAAELTYLARAAKGAAPARSVGDVSPKPSRGRAVWRSGRLLLEAKNGLPEYGSVLRLISPAFLFAVFLAFVAAWAEIIFAIVALLIAAIARLS